MGKHLLFLPFFLLFPALLFGSVWNSNVLGQKLSIKEAQEGIGWERVDSEGVSTLYFNGWVAKARTADPDVYEEQRGEESVRGRGTRKKDY